MSFSFPEYYSFPPFFSRQASEATRKKQLMLWADLILNYCKANRIGESNVSDLMNTPLFENKKINSIYSSAYKFIIGKVSQEFLTEILDNLVALKNAEYTNKEHTKICIYWRSIAAWAKLIYQYVDSTGQSNGSILTLYDLQEADETDGEEFHGLDTETLMKALKQLENEGKAEVFNSSEGNIGIKFFKK